MTNSRSIRMSSMLAHILMSIHTKLYLLITVHLIHILLNVFGESIAIEIFFTGRLFDSIIFLPIGIMMAMSVLVGTFNIVTVHLCSFLQYMFMFVLVHWVVFVAVLFMQAYRWVADSRDQYTEER